MGYPITKACFFEGSDAYSRKTGPPSAPTCCLHATSDGFSKRGTAHPIQGLTRIGGQNRRGTRPLCYETATVNVAKALSAGLLLSKTLTVIFAIWALPGFHVIKPVEALIDAAGGAPGARL